MNIAFIADTHFTDKVPFSRVEVSPYLYLKTELERFSYVLKECQNLNIKKLFIAGDMFHTPTIPYPVVRKISRTIEDFNGVVQVYSILGNHDTYTNGYMLNTAIENLDKITPNFSVLTEDLYIPELNTVVVPCHWGSEQNQLLITNAQITSRPIDDASIIALSHLNIGYGYGTTNPEIFENHVNFDYAIFGDIHTGFPRMVNSGGSVIYNPGSFTIRNIDQIGHQPSMMVIGKDTEGKFCDFVCSIQTKQFTNLLIKPQNTKIEKLFNTSLEKVKKSREHPVIDTVLELAEKNNVSDEVLDELVSRLT